MKRIYAPLVIALVLSMAGQSLRSEDTKPLPSLNPPLEQSLSAYLKANYRSPEDYIVHSFSDHQVIFLGEPHRVRQCAELVQSLIPALYEAGVYNLATEYACFEDQALIDRLLSGDTFDRDLAYQIQFNQWPYMGFREYIDIYRVAWEFNAGLPEGATPFRIVGINARADFSLIRSPGDTKDPAVMRKVRKAGPRDSVMAATIMREVVDKGQKALVYCGFGHAFTKFRWPREGPLKCSAFTDQVGTVGNRVYAAVGEQTMFVFIHAPWFGRGDERDTFVYPADGVIDTLMLTLGPRYGRVGFDVAGTPFAKLPGDSSYWAEYYNDFTLGRFCDGYVYLGPLSTYRGMTVADNFITEQNRLEAIMQNPNTQWRDSSRSVSEVMEAIARDANIEQRFRMFR